MNAKADLFDENPRPDLGDQFLVADHLARVLDKDEQNIECTAAKLDRFVGFLENTLRGKQSKRPEGNDLPAGYRQSRVTARLEQRGVRH
jgi:hypothetical protein